jgi:catechol 2,3-dioxygenase-like lactoylglutathione lyase family enzyme
MKVKRIVANIATPDVAKAKAFYRDILGLDLLMDHGWIATYGSDAKMSVQISIASEGGSGTPARETSRHQPGIWSRRRALGCQTILCA